MGCVCVTCCRSSRVPALLARAHPPALLPACHPPHSYPAQSLDYGVPESNILGVRYGFQGFYDRRHKPVTLTRAAVEDIHLEGGTILGTSRGLPNVPEIVKRLGGWLWAWVGCGG